MRNVEGFKLGVKLTVDGGSQYRSEFRDADKYTNQLTKSIQQLGKEGTKLNTGLKAGFSTGFKAAATDFHKQIEQFSRSSRLNAIGQIAGQTVGQGMQQGIGSVLSSLGSTVGSLIGTAIAPGIGTAVGSTVGSAIDAAMAKAAAVVGPLIQQGIEYNKLIELQRIHFTSFSGSEVEADKHIKFLKELSLISFDLPGVLAASQRLEEFTGNLDDTRLMLQAIADQTAAFRPGDLGYFNSLADTLGLIVERGELTSRELNKIRRMGVDVTGLLSEATGWSPKQIERMLKAGELRGEVAARMIAQGIERQKGGFAALVDASTLAGREGSFQEGLRQRAAEATKSTADVMSDYYRSANEILAGPQAQRFVDFLNSSAGQLFSTIEKAVSVGAALPQGIQQGVQGGITSLKSTITGMGNEAIETLKTLWGTHSPSTVFAEQGKFAMEGLAQGILENEGVLTSALDQVFNNATNQTKMWAAGLGGQTLRDRYTEAAKNPLVLAVLEGIRQIEGGRPDNMAGGRRVSDLSQHPGYTVPFNQWFKGPLGRSSASGNWQETLTNWKRILPMMGLDPKTAPFSIENQMLVALRLLDEEKGLEPLMRGELSEGLKGTQPWAASPFSNLPGRKATKEKFLSIINSLRGGGSQLTATVSRESEPTINELVEWYRNRFASPPAPLRDISGGAGTGIRADIPRLISELPKGLTYIDATIRNFKGVNAEFPELTNSVRDLGQKGTLLVPVFGELGVGVPPVTEALKGFKKEVENVTDAQKKKNREDLRKKREEPGFFSGRTFGTVDDEGNPIKVGPAKMAIRGLKSAFGDLKQMGKDVFGQFASGIGSMVENFVLLGETGPDALRKLAAQAIASLAAQATVQAIYWTAQGIVDIFFNPARAAADFAGAALFASIAGLSILGGRALAGDRFKDKNQQTVDNSQYGEEGFSGNQFIRRALGGGISRGRAYIVGEHRPEVFVPDEDGYMEPSIGAYARRHGRGGGGGASSQVLARLAAFLDRMESAPADTWLRIAAKRVPGVVAEANAIGLEKNAGLVNRQQRAMGL